MNDCAKLPRRVVMVVSPRRGQSGIEVLNSEYSTIDAYQFIIIIQFSFLIVKPFWLLSNGNDTNGLISSDPTKEIEEPLWLGIGSSGDPTSSTERERLMVVCNSFKTVLYMWLNVSSGLGYRDLRETWRDNCLLSGETTFLIRYVTLLIARDASCECLSPQLVVRGLVYRHGDSPHHHHRHGVSCWRFSWFGSSKGNDIVPLHLFQEGDTVDL